MSIENEFSCFFCVSMTAKLTKFSKYSHSFPTPKMRHHESQQQTRPLNRFIMDKTAG